MQTRCTMFLYNNSRRINTEIGRTVPEKNKNLPNFPNKLSYFSFMYK